MLQDVKLDVFYPYPPERVWNAITDRRALADWMMENDFEPHLGHKFRFRSAPLPGVEVAIQCEIIELDEPHRLVYTWQDSPSHEPSLVVWTLTAVEGGTRLQLKHQERSYAVAIASKPSTRKDSQESMELGMFLLSVGSGDYQPIPSCFPGSASQELGLALTQELYSPQSFGWDYYLKQRLLEVLADR
jgi:uncharacterized protein YndB with AHSA1/START domain